MAIRMQFEQPLPQERWSSGHLDAYTYMYLRSSRSSAVLDTRALPPLGVTRNILLHSRPPDDASGMIRNTNPKEGEERSTSESPYGSGTV